MTSATPQLAPGRRERRRREIHERIIDAAVGLFQRKGFNSTTALEIADHADVAEKTFYNHFPTKQHLIEELAGRSLATTAALLAEAREAPGTTADRLRRFCERAADVAERGSRELTREVLLELVRVAQVDGIGPEHHRQLHVAISTILEEGLERGDIQPGRDVDFISELGVAAYLGIIINWVTLPNYPLRERLLLLAEVGAELLESRITHRPEKADR
jgi:AcrR family transcriptional regulator